MLKYSTVYRYVEEYTRRIKIPNAEKIKNYTLPQLLGFVDPEIPYETEVLYKDLIFKHEYLLDKEIFIKYSDLDALTPLCLKLFHSWVHYHKTPFHKPWTVWDILNLRKFAFEHNCRQFWYYYRWQISVWMQHKIRVKKGYTEQLLQLIPEMYYVNYYAWYKQFNYNDELITYIKYSSYKIVQINSGIVKYLKERSNISDKNVIGSLIAIACIRKFDFSMLAAEPIEGVCRWAWQNDFRATKWELFQHPGDLTYFDSIPSIYYGIDTHNSKFEHVNKIYKLSLILPIEAVKMFYNYIEYYENKQYKLHNFDKICYTLEDILVVLTVNREADIYRSMYFKAKNHIRTLATVKYLALYNSRFAFLLNEVPKNKKKSYQRFTTNANELMTNLEIKFRKNTRIHHYDKFVSLELLRKYH